VARDGDEGHILLGVVAQLVCALLAEREAHGLALAQLARALRRAQRRAPAQHQDQLLVGVVEVVRVGGLAGRQLPEAAADQLGPEVVSDAGAAALEAGGALVRLEVGLVDVGHRRVLAHGDSTTLKKPSSLVWNFA
jgi:hypothetical protein